MLLWEFRHRRATTFEDPTSPRHDGNENADFQALIVKLRQKLLQISRQGVKLARFAADAGQFRHYRRIGHTMMLLLISLVP